MNLKRRSLIRQSLELFKKFYNSQKTYNLNMRVDWSLHLVRNWFFLLFAVQLITSPTIWLARHPKPAERATCVVQVSVHPINVHRPSRVHTSHSCNPWDSSEQSSYRSIFPVLISEAITWTFLLDRCKHYNDAFLGTHEMTGVLGHDSAL